VTPPQYLFHFSEDPTITRFEPHVAKTQQIEGAWVWADDELHSPRYWFPRQCPRATWWPKGDTEWSHRVHAIQWDWWDRFLAAEVYAYRFDGAPFHENPGGGGWRTTEMITPIEVVPIGPLLDRHRDARVELRVVSDLKKLWNEVIELPGINFSGIRLRNLEG
jgi:hypothetical protein